MRLLVGSLPEERSHENRIILAKCALHQIVTDLDRIRIPLRESRIVRRRKCDILDASNDLSQIVGIVAFQRRGKRCRVIFQSKI